ncbi:hypothetical protein AX774_g2215 [Zancudomyces culisetae]|uniref:Uncharacterized protein n=1 Tax=Zancudomyces culisetae TaxID=1213189 RepID=A0A1R1PTH5_ZANCU|nr:hypothetical protein AX774_g2215 [Zancudomyces culisetae]|eukprot:OMH84270.1 hypothetical protein AX774_g2215 [Zancudomyces culisetae]
MNKYDYTGKGRAELNAQYFKEMYPKDLTLSQVLVFHRHGKTFYPAHANLFHEQFRNRLRAEIDSNSPGSTTPLDLSHRNSDSNVSDEYWKIKRKGRIFPDKATPPPDEQKKKDEKKMEGGGGSINKVIHEESEEEYFSRANMNSCGWGQLSDVGWKSMYEVEVNWGVQICMFVQQTTQEHWNRFTRS